MQIYELVSEDARKLASGSNISLIELIETESTLPQDIYGQENTPNLVLLFPKGGSLPGNTVNGTMLSVYGMKPKPQGNALIMDSNTFPSLKGLDILVIGLR
ncbi:MAG: hypothetical protein V9G29_14385 [Burkholderiaceae bacterium]